MTIHSGSLFWDKFYNKASAYSSNLATIRSLANYTKNYIDFFHEKPLELHTAYNVYKYINYKGVNTTIPFSEYTYLLISLKILFVEIIKSDWAEHFVWDEFIQNIHCVNNIPQGDLPSLQISSIHLISFNTYQSPFFIAAYSRFPIYIDLFIKALHLKNYSLATEKIYMNWLVRFLNYFETSNAILLDENSIKDFILEIVVKQKVLPSTQSQALTAILFFFKAVLYKDYHKKLQNCRPKNSRTLPTVLSQQEVVQFFSNINHPVFNLMTKLIYGCGLRLMECICLQVADIDFSTQQILVRQITKQSNRFVTLPNKLTEALKIQIDSVEKLHSNDITNVGLSADTPFQQYYLFPSPSLSQDPNTSAIRRHHIHKRGLQKAIYNASKLASIYKVVNCHVLRHSFAAHLLHNGCDIRTTQELLGHTNVKTTLQYVNILNQAHLTVVSPLDTLT